MFIASKTWYIIRLRVSIWSNILNLIHEDKISVVQWCLLFFHYSTRSVSHQFQNMQHWEKSRPVCCLVLLALWQKECDSCLPENHGGALSVQTWFTWNWTVTAEYLVQLHLHLISRFRKYEPLETHRRTNCNVPQNGIELTAVHFTRNTQHIICKFQKTKLKT